MSYHYELSLWVITMSHLNCPISNNNIYKFHKRITSLHYISVFSSPHPQCSTSFWAQVWQSRICPLNVDRALGRAIFELISCSNSWSTSPFDAHHLDRRICLVRWYASPCRETHYDFPSLRVDRPPSPDASDSGWTLADNTIPFSFSPLEIRSSTVCRPPVRDASSTV